MADVLDVVVDGVEADGPGGPTEAPGGVGHGDVPAVGALAGQSVEVVLAAAEAMRQHHHWRRADLESLRLATKAEFDLFRSEVSSEFAAVRSEMGSEFALVRSEMREMEERLVGTVHRELGAAISSQTRTLVLALIGAMATSSGLAFAAAARLV